MKRKEAEKYRSIIEEATKSLEDKLASEAPNLFPTLEYINKLISSGTRINWSGTLKRATVDLWDTEENNPDNAPELWEDIGYKEGYRIIPSVITAGLAFQKDELGWWEETLFKSLIDSNVWTPTDNPSGWEIIE